MQKWWGREGFQNASAADPDNMCNSYDPCQWKTSLISYSWKILVVYMSHNSVYINLTFNSTSQNQTYSLINIYNNNQQILETISYTYAYATLFSLLFCDWSSLVSVRDFQYASMIWPEGPTMIWPVGPTVNWPVGPNMIWPEGPNIIDPNVPLCPLWFQIQDKTITDPL